ncbi:hemerythrin domain-containing protein [Paraflavitalea speifideaquila]|uniref:hemerythrin domain-containing protein n=1 Tax=Paraflavitalea speifideaquila TaxID=3076558 RepID=UPI0028E76462|nr:hemerythrin domain-containing protein [Paraflavitalea speifideiaquila]
MERNTVLQPFLNHLASDRQICTQLLGNMMAGKSSKTTKLAVENFWLNNLQKHIEAEERTLIPFLIQHHFGLQYTNLLHREHDTIRVLAERLREAQEGDYLYEVFVKLVHEHLLFEDRVIFTRIAETIPEQELEQLRLVA